MSYVKIIADSISPDGVRLTTLEVEIHRFILPEFNTHREFSRNSSSSRAIPFSKIVNKIKERIAFPYKWGTNQPGMQSGPPLEGNDVLEAEKIWRESFESVLEHAYRLEKLNIHKEVINRLIEPYMFHRVIVSATSYENFFTLRCSDLAQEEIKIPAESIREAISNNIPKQIGYGQWHLPYVTDEELNMFGVEYCKKISSARCARVSYLTHDGTKDIDADIKLFNRLIEPVEGEIHASPFEHVARPLYTYEPSSYGNFHGWMQWRHILEFEKNKG